MAAQPQPAATREIAMTKPTKPGEAAAGNAGSRKPTEADIRAEQEKREKQAFDQAAQQIREAVRADPNWRNWPGSLQIDITPDGLRIQILDAEREAMFPLGSAVPNDHARLLLQKVALVLAKLPEDISIAGSYRCGAVHRCRPQQLGTVGGSRQRHAAAAGGLGPAGTRIRSVTGNAERDLLIPPIRWRPRTAASPSRRCARSRLPPPRRRESQPC